MEVMFFLGLRIVPRVGLVLVLFEPFDRHQFVNFPLLPISVWKQQIDFKQKYLEGGRVWGLQNPSGGPLPSGGFVAASVHQQKRQCVVWGAGELRSVNRQKFGGGGREVYKCSRHSPSRRPYIFFPFLLLFPFFHFTINIQSSVSTLPLEMEFLSLDSCYKIKSLFIQLHE